MLQRNVLLNPGPVTTSHGVKQALLVPDTCPREEHFKKLMAGVRDRLVGVVGDPRDYAAVIFESSGTGGLDACCASVVPRGRKLLVLSNGGYGERILEIAEAYELDTLAYTVPWGDPLDESAVESLLREHRGQVSHVAVVHHETTTGMLNDVNTYSALAHSYDAEIIVDAISSYGGLPIDVAASGIDYLVASPSKCLQSMPGLSFVICRREHLERDGRDGPRSYYLDLHAQHRFFEASSGIRFTAPVQVFSALDQALEEYFEETGERRYQRYAMNHAELVEGLRKLGFRFLLPPAQRSPLMVAVMVPTNPRYSYDDMHDYLLSRGFVVYPEEHSAPGAFRLANMGDIHRGDIRAFLAALKEFLGQKNLLGRLYEIG